jgi:NAD(P)-dependent dehydrogenase (short-subunit alcohol dehydrogenase family)
LTPEEHAAPRLLEDKVALVTGAGRGWGQGIAQAFARHGARVVATSRTQSELDRTAGLIREEGGHVLVVPADLAQVEDVRRLTERVLETYGRLDVLVNNAGRLPRLPLAEMSVEEWDLTLAVNLRAAFLTCKFFLDTLLAQERASIINVSSNAGVYATANMTAYCASKFGIEGFSRALAQELQPHNIAVNTITPAGLRHGVRIKPTSVTQAMFDAMSPEEQAQYTDPIFFTEAFVFLALQDGDGVTGQRVLAYPLSEHIRQAGWDVGHIEPFIHPQTAAPL